MTLVLVACPACDITISVRATAVRIRRLGRPEDFPARLAATTTCPDCLGPVSRPITTAQARELVNVGIALPLTNVDLDLFRTRLERSGDTPLAHIKGTP